MSTTYDELREYVERRGRCAQFWAREQPLPDDPWFDPQPPRGCRARGKQALAARAACAGCPVTTECLQIALVDEAATGMSWGYWGATAPAERRAMLDAHEPDHAPEYALDIAC